MHLIIPMSGIGKRFIDAGYTDPKPLINVDGMPIIQHVINIFPNISKISFICNDYHLDNTNMEYILRQIAPNCNILRVSINNRKGPVDAIYQHFDIINDNEEIIVSYCDYGTWWDYETFINDMHTKNADGGIPCYIGFHPHMLGKDNYAFVKHNNMLLEEIREKQNFTNNKMQEYASNGTYYFKTGEILKKYFKMAIDMNLSINNEYYVSIVYNLLVKDNLKVYINEIDNMLQWGTPYDLECYNMWSNYFKNDIHNFNPNKYNTITILPMGGKGSRFSMDGYEIPKPLLSVNNKPMVIEAVQCLPQSKETIFVILEEHYDKYPIGENIKKYIDNSKIDLIKDVTNGQSTTCMVAINNHKIDPDQSILISACDNGVYYDIDKYDKLMQDNTIDVIVWSFSNNPTSKLYPNMYAWLDVDKYGNILKVSNKKPFIDRENKYCIIGTMFFRKCKYFIEGYKYITDNEIKTNNEYYVDDLLNYLIDNKYNVKVFNVDYYLCWGTPNDYKTYLYWQDFFNKCWWHPYQKEKIYNLHIAHRINNPEELINVPKFCGIELDLRDSNGKIIVTHDPFTDGIEFEEYIKNYNHNFIILNIKSEGIEYNVKKIIDKYKINDYFFLDCSFPMIYKLSKNGEKNIAIRLSEYEDINSILNLSGLINWIWIDCFTKLPINNNIYKKLKENRFKLCLVSPELHDLNRVSEIEKYRKYLIDNNIQLDAICTKIKNIKKW